MSAANLGYRRTFAGLKQMTNKTNELSHLSSKSDKLYPPQDWGSCTGWEYHLQEPLATPGQMPAKVAPHTGWLHPALLPREPL